MRRLLFGHTFDRTRDSVVLLGGVQELRQREVVTRVGFLVTRRDGHCGVLREGVEQGQGGLKTVPMIN